MAEAHSISSPRPTRDRAPRLPIVEISAAPGATLLASSCAVSYGALVHSNPKEETIMAAHPATPISPSKILNEIRKLDQLYARAVETRDLETLLNLYDPNATVLPPHAPVANTKEDVRNLFQALLTLEPSNFQINTTHVEEAGDLAIATGTFRVSLRDIEDRGKFLGVFRRNKKGELRLIYDTWNSDLPPTLT
jgi:ketosteroid isomerase-like protein